MKRSNSAYRLVFLDATDQALVQRFESTRRPHPLQGKDRIVDGIAREREKLEDIRSQSDVAIDTSNLNVHQLENELAKYLVPENYKAFESMFFPLATSMEFQLTQIWF